MPDADRVGMYGEHDWDRPGRLPGGLNFSGRRREDEVDIHVDQLVGEFGQLVDVFRPSPLDDHILPLDITEVMQARPQRLYRSGPGSGRGEAKESDASDPRRLLRLRRDRPHRRAAEQRDELAPL
jgi:hypothetical protein